MDEGGPQQAPQAQHQDARSWFGAHRLGLIGVGIPLLLAIVWYWFGGFPRDHDRYGSIPVPGQGVVLLPAGEVRLYFEASAANDASPDQPPGFNVGVRPRGSREELEVERFSPILPPFELNIGDRGWEPVGNVEIPEAGRYEVAGAPGAPGSPELTIGPPPWNPLGSPLLGALLVFGLTGGLVLGVKRTLFADATR